MCNNSKKKINNLNKNSTQWRVNGNEKEKNESKMTIKDSFIALK